MDKEKRSLFQRIRNAKQSLENAEKSFQDNRGMRGELDLMLAEAELKNLRNKQPTPWRWNRNLFAFSIAVLLVIAGFGGWYFARGAVISAEVVPVQPASQQENLKHADLQNASVKENKVDINYEKSKDAINKITSKTEDDSPQVHLSEKDMRNLVRSAKSELSNGK